MIALADLVPPSFPDSSTSQKLRTCFGRPFGRLLRGGGQSHSWDGEEEEGQWTTRDQVKVDRTSISSTPTSLNYSSALPCLPYDFDSEASYWAIAPVLSLFIQKWLRVGGYGSQTTEGLPSLTSRLLTPPTKNYPHHLALKKMILEVIA